MNWTSRAARRSAFTLIELLIVILIIAILASMSVPAALRVLERTREVGARHEISQLAQALGAFKAKFGEYPPSRVDLSGGDPVSAAFLRRCWPRMRPGALGTGVLQSDQVLVFFLGGKQGGTSRNGSCYGFSDDPQNPFNPVGLGNIRPFYEFRSDRLVDVRGNGFFSYIDYYNNPINPMPYIYFATDPRMGNSYVPASAFGVSPYYSVPSPIRFINADSFQIICAGADGRFGPGGLYQPAVGVPNGTPGWDDLANFHPNKLGIPSN
ncbi:MAG: prepilin-type N-terminal cleavage/methylation domain-containing protein [Gemmataceae bacterium]|nr:prepilin-type N-terminal cleavage/methylation domain-containing protein [Gemmataceae bacterium]MDW8266972.1 prepilin-type N-terminal cleavage/methylation domain-containing protein [Gemmataceae bacterium]